MVDAREALAREVVLRRVVVVVLLLGTGVTSTVAEDAAASDLPAAGLAAELDAVVLAAWDAPADAAEEADERRRGAGVAMTGGVTIGMER